jgi:uncharacterized protein YeaO (DUF488 family)
MARPVSIRTARVYEERGQQDGVRILVDRLWPRGMTKARADLDEWRKEIAPSTALRTWYHHDSKLYPEFRRRYRAELCGAEQAVALEQVIELARSGTVTLLTASKDLTISEAGVLAELIEELFK